jgi:hypothetical protein
MTLHFRPFLKPFYCEMSLFCTSQRAWIAAIYAVIRIFGRGASMKLLLVACVAVLALIVMDSSQVVTGPMGLTLKGGQALAADLGRPAPPPPPPYIAPVGKGKAPILGKGKGKAPPAPIVTRG